MTLDEGPGFDRSQSFGGQVTEKNDPFEEAKARHSFVSRDEFTAEDPLELAARVYRDLRPEETNQVERARST